MRTYDEALEYSEQHPTEVVEFRGLDYVGLTKSVGFFLNGEREGAFEYYNRGVLHHKDIYNSKTKQAEHFRFRCNGSISRHFFSQNSIIHGEYRWFNTEGAVIEQCFYNSGTSIDELDYLVHTDRDDVFYVTLALYGIGKEYTFN